MSINIGWCNYENETKNNYIRQISDIYLLICCLIIGNNLKCRCVIFRMKLFTHTLNISETGIQKRNENGNYCQQEMAQTSILNR